MSIQSIDRVLLKDRPKVGTPVFTFEVVIDKTKCTGCGICAIECPSKIIEMVGREQSDVSVPACAEACYADNGIRDAVRLLNDGASVEEAWRQIVKSNPLPAITGRVCPHPCEDECNRNHLDSALNVHEVERYIGDAALQNDWQFTAPEARNLGKVAVIGAGPAGLAAAYQLARFGYDVTVYEKNAKAGGVLTYGIPAYRLPRDIVAQEVQRIANLGVQFKYNCALGQNFTLSDLQKDYDAVFLGLGLQDEVTLNIPGEDASNIFSGMQFLEDIANDKHPIIGNDVLVVGGGNVAIDSARTALREGARKVTLVCLEQRYAMPAWASEVHEAEEEGVRIVNGYGPMRIELRDGQATKVVLKRCTAVFDADGRFSPSYDESDHFEIDVTAVITAIGQKPEKMTYLGGVKMGPAGHVAIFDEQNMKTSLDTVYAGGDMTRSDGTGKIIGAIGMGTKAALAIDRQLQGKERVFDKDANPYTYRSRENLYHALIDRTEAASLSMKERFADEDNEVNQGFSEAQMRSEIDRCLQCGTGKAEYIGKQKAVDFNMACNNCHNCVAVCPEDAVRFRYYNADKDGNWIE